VAQEVEVPVWWWPVSVFGASLPLVFVLGTVYLDFSKIKLEEILRVPPPVETVRYKTASMFKELLDKKGFNTTLQVFAESVVVDFFHPEVRKLIEGLPYRRPLIETLTTYSTAGTVEFTDFGVTDANVPVVMARDPAATGRLKHLVKLYEGMRLEEAHWHVHDGLTVFDLHLSQALPEKPSRREMRGLAEAFADVIDQTTKASISFLTTLKGE